MSGILPAGIPAPLQNLIQTNTLSRMIREGLQVHGRYRADATPIEMPAGIGESVTFPRLGHMAVDTMPIEPVGATPRGSFNVEQFTGRPVPYGRTIDIDGPTAYSQVGNLMNQAIGRLAAYAGTVSSRLARTALFRCAAGQSIIRRAQTTADSVLYVNSLAGLRFVMISGKPTAVSASTPLGVTIVAATTFTALVTGVTPLNAKYPDGPGLLTLSTTLSANVAANSYVYVTGARPYVVRPTNRASTEALVSGDIPTLQDILKMKAKEVDRGMMPHAASGLYHLAVDPYFFSFVTQDTAYRQFFQTKELPAALSNLNAVWSPQTQMAVIETNDSPAVGKGSTIAVGGSAATSIGATGTPGSSLTQEDSGLDVVNSSGVYVRRAILTGDDVLNELYVDHMKIMAAMGAQKIVDVTQNLAVYATGAGQIVAGNVDRWTLIIRPAMDERAMSCSVTVCGWFDYVLPTDADAFSDTSDASPYKRGVVLEHGALA